MSSADDKVSLWDFSVEPDELGGEVAVRTRPGEQGEEVEEIPPQLMFLHQGQKNVKEVRFHPLFDSMLLSTAEDSYNVFRPNLDPEQQPDSSSEDESE